MIALECNLEAPSGVQLYNVNRWWIATMVLILVLCILVIIVSPYVDLPLTTARTFITAVLFAQILLLGSIPNKLRFSLTARRVYSSALPMAECRLSVQLLDWLCAYLC